MATRFENYFTANRLILTRPSDLSLPLILYDPNDFMVITSDRHHKDFWVPLDKRRIRDSLTYFSYAE
jgi:hypothetical protein